MNLIPQTRSKDRRFSFLHIHTRDGVYHIKLRDKEWVESEHPRGQPGNAGQFAAEPGGGKASTESPSMQSGVEPQEKASGNTGTTGQQRPNEPHLAGGARTYERATPGGSTGLRLRSDTDGAPVKTVYKPTGDIPERFKQAGLAVPTWHELAEGGETAFYKHISDAKGEGPYGAAVHVYSAEEYKNMRLFLTPDGTAGFALKGEDIVSVFKASKGPSHIVPSMLDLATEEGGRKLDCFDTALPHLYANRGFKAVARLPWNDEYKPEDWDYDTFKNYNNGRPDVVFMTYDPANAKNYKAGDGAKADDYDHAVALQQEAITKTGLPGSKGGDPNQIPSRWVTSKKVGSDYYRQPSIEAMKLDQKAFSDNMDLFKNANHYPNFRDLEGKTPDQIATAVKDHIKSNLKFLYDHAPPEIQGPGRHWYRGANRIASEASKKYDLPMASVTGVYAALSPQKDWDQNVYLGDHMIDIYKNQQDHKWDADMEKAATAISGKSKEVAAIVKLIKDKKLNELTDPTLKGVWIRMYDEAHSDRSYQRIGPNGDRHEDAKNDDGTLARAAWQTNSAMANAVISIESGGNPKVIGEALGEKHKVRSFYNNILDPESPNGDVTIDTHAVGAGLLRALGGNSVAVSHNFGSNPLAKHKPKDWKQASNSAVTGSKGLYAIYADAYRELAKELDMQPRELQSVTWEAKRRLFPTSMPDKVKKQIETTWHDYHDGKQDLKATQNKILELAGKSFDPDRKWN